MSENLETIKRGRSFDQFIMISPEVRYAWAKICHGANSLVRQYDDIV